jgi:hypothetical protein
VCDISFFRTDSLGSARRLSNSETAPGLILRLAIRSVKALLFIAGECCGILHPQTTVTADGTGTVNNIPKDSGSTLLMSSAVSAR